MRKNYLNNRWFWIRDISVFVLSLGCGAGCGKFAHAIALAERHGIHAIGGEILIFPIVTYLAYKLFTFIFDQLEDMLNDYFAKEHYRRIAEKRNTRGFV